MNEQEPLEGGFDELDQPEPGERESVDALPVLADVRVLEPTRPPVPPSVQAAAVAATGFVAGAATFALLKRRGMRKLARQASELDRLRRAQAMMRPAGPAPLTPWAVGTSRTYLVNVRVIAPPQTWSPPTQ